MSERIDFIPGNALTTEWPAGQDVVLLSYLLSAVSLDGRGSAPGARVCGR